MDCVMDGVSLAQTYLTGHCETEVLHLLIRGLLQITQLETVHILTLISQYLQVISQLSKLPLH